MQPDSIGALLDGPFEVRARPLPIAGDLRLNWGVAMVVLILGFSRSGRASFQKLHFLAHSARSDQLRSDAAELLRSEATLLIPAIRVEPWVNRAVAFAHGVGILQALAGGSVQLNETGKELFKKLRQNSSLLAEEQAFLADVASAATERNVNRAMRMENSKWA